MRKLKTWKIKSEIASAIYSGATADRLVRRGRMLRGFVLALSSAVLLVPGAMLAVEFDDLTATNEGKRYWVHAEGVIDAPFDEVLAAIVDFPNLTALSDTILESELLDETPDEGDGAVVRTRIKFCVLLICSRATQIQVVTQPRVGEVVSIAIPERSDIQELTQRWTITAVGEQTHLIFEMEVFNEEFIPPLIGPPLVRRKLRSISRDTASNIEQIARRAAGMDGA
jgi:Polyketide cyclase / dehydrase and lipid transport